jgi:tripartite motif-containing protein 2/3
MVFGVMLILGEQLLLMYYLFQELLFCETCDTVFCTLCTGGTHKPGPGSSGLISGSDSGNNSPIHNSSSSTVDHTVIPFSIAIKRMSEILIYKANECTAKVT